MNESEKVLFLDAEFVDNQEVIELSVWDLSEKEVFNSYFNPRKIKSWPKSQAIHNIKPEDVAGSPFFSEKKGSMQSIFDKSEIIVGFSIDGDIEHLEAMGLKGLRKKRLVDVKDFYWMYLGRYNNLDYYGLPGLEKCAAELGIEFGGMGAHSAHEDALVTRRCLIKLMKSRSVVNEIQENGHQSDVGSNTADTYGPDNFELEYREFMNLLNDFNNDFPVIKDEYERAKAAGNIIVKDVGDGYYRIYYKRTPLKDPSKYTVVTPVEDILRAEQDMLKRFSKKAVNISGSVYRLSEKDLHYIRSYTNEYVSGEDRSMARKLLKLSKSFTIG